MARCNILKQLTNTTGEFVTFSLWPDDLTREIADANTRRCVPERFIALRLNDIEGLDVALPNELQSYYENLLSYIKEINSDPGKTHVDYNALDGLMHTLVKGEFIDTPAVVGSSVDTYCNNIYYIGDINVHSTRTVDGVAYNDTYCYIPVDSGAYYYRMDYAENTTPVFDPTSAETGAVVTEDSYIDGWTDESYPQGTELSSEAYFDAIENGYGYYYEPFTHLPMDNASLAAALQRDMSAENEDSSAEYYHFNAIIILYNIYDNTGAEPSLLKSDVPMGLYITSPDGSRLIKKYISSENAFGQGSSYGLRVMTRYAAVPNGTVYTETVSSTDDGFTGIADAMSTMADALVTLTEDITGHEHYTQELKDHLAQFRNNRTNVPYVREVNGEQHWFVNGRDTGQLVTYKEVVEVPVSDDQQDIINYIDDNILYMH